MTIPADMMNQIVTGDARELAKRIPDESVDLIFTDPVYDRIEDYEWLAQTAVRVLKPGAAVLAFTYTATLPETLTAMSRHMTYQWVTIWHRNNEMKFRYSPVGKSVYVPAVVFSKGAKLKRTGFAFDLRSYPVWSIDSNHPWSKPPEWVEYYMAALCAAGGIVYDPFTGGGTVPAVCKMLGRNFIASEIDPDTAERARERLRMTQPPLFVATEEQAVMEVGA
jgi:DNA modification methylase